MNKLIVRIAVVILGTSASGCEEINHVRVVAPRDLVGATVTVPGTEMRAKLAKVRSDSTVETDQDLPLPPLDDVLVVERVGCQPITLSVRGKIGQTTIVIRREQIRCNGGR